jgi:hypothetical protein
MGENKPYKIYAAYDGEEEETMGKMTNQRAIIHVRSDVYSRYGKQKLAEYTYDVEHDAPVDGTITFHVTNDNPCGGLLNYEKYEPYIVRILYWDFEFEESTDEGVIFGTMYAEIMLNLFTCMGAELHCDQYPPNDEAERLMHEAEAEEASRGNDSHLFWG